MERARDRPVLGTIRLAVSIVWASGRRQVVWILVATVVTSLAQSPDSCSSGGRLLDLLVGDEEGVELLTSHRTSSRLGVLLMVSTQPAKRCRERTSGSPS